MTQDPLLEQAAATLPKPTLKRVPLDDVSEADLTGAPNASVSSMESDGLLEAVKLYARGEGQLLGVADGNRRVANARKLGWTHIDAFVYPALSGTQLAHLQLGLHLRAPNLVTEALALGRLMQGGGGTVDEELARESKLSVTRVRKLRKLLALPRDVLELTGTVLSEGTAEAVANLQGEHRVRAVALIRTRASEDRGRFTNADLKDIQLARNDGLAALLGGVGVAMPVVTLSAVDLLAAQVRVMCSEAQVDLGDLCRVLAQNEAPIPLQGPVTRRPVAPWEEEQSVAHLDLPDMFGVTTSAKTEKLMQALFGSTSRTGQPDPWDLPTSQDATANPGASVSADPAPASVPPSVDDVIHAAVHRSEEEFTQTANRRAALAKPEIAVVPAPVDRPRAGGASFGVRSFGTIRSRTS